MNGTSNKTSMTLQSKNSESLDSNNNNNNSRLLKKDMVTESDENGNMILKYAKKQPLICNSSLPNSSCTSSSSESLQSCDSKKQPLSAELSLEEELLESSSLNWSLDCSDYAKNTTNPVRKLIEQMKIEPNPDLAMIALSIGDPTIQSDIGKPESVSNAIVNCIKEKKYDGYTPSYGTEIARQAVAKYYSKPDYLVYKPQDIYLTNGCSQALDLCITVLANRGQNIIIPKPGFSIYKTLSGTLGIDVKYYQLLDEHDWQIDLEGLESLIDEKTVGIIVNNPSNPCGSVYSKEHLTDIIKVAEKYRLPIIADEVYGDMVFPGKEFYYMAELTNTVPILSCNALSKRFLLPGWRFGWIAIHDPQDHLKRVRTGFNDLTTRILGPNSLVQGAVPEILETTPQEYFDNVMQILSENAEVVYESLKSLPGLTPRQSSGAMYLMVAVDLKCFPAFKTDLEFVQGLIREKSVFCLPAQIFECPGYIRIVITMKKEKIMEACARIADFVHSHYKKE